MGRFYWQPLIKQLLWLLFTLLANLPHWVSFSTIVTFHTSYDLPFMSESMVTLMRLLTSTVTCLDVHLLPLDLPDIEAITGRCGFEPSQYSAFCSKSIVMSIKLHHQSS